MHDPTHNHATISTTGMQSIAVAVDEIVDRSTPAESILRVLSSCAVLLETSHSEPIDEPYVIEILDISMLSEQEFVAASQAFSVVKERIGFQTSIRFQGYAEWSPDPEISYKPKSPATVHAVVVGVSSCLGQIDFITKHDNPTIHALVAMFRSCVEMVRCSHMLYDDVFVAIGHQDKDNKSLLNYISVDVVMIAAQILDEISQICKKRFQYDSL